MVFAKMNLDSNKHSIVEINYFTADNANSIALPKGRVNLPHKRIYYSNLSIQGSLLLTLYKLKGIREMEFENNYRYYGGTAREAIRKNTPDTESNDDNESCEFYIEPESELDFCSQQ